MSFPRLILAALCAPLTLAGCSSLPVDLGRGDVVRDLSARGLAPPDAMPTALTQAWLAEPLSLDRAIQIALLNNPELRAQTATLGLAAADVYEAGRLANPLLSASWLSAGSEPHAQLTLGIAVNFTDLLFLHTRSKIADAQFESARLSVGGATLDLAAEVEAAYRRVSAATRQSQLQATLTRAAQASATLAQRYYAAGNLPLRDLALEQAAASEAALDADSAGLELELARGDFSRLLGLPIDDKHWTLAESLALPVAQEDSTDALLKLAIDTRLDLAAARRHADAVAQGYGLTRHTRVLADTEIGAQREREYDGSVHAGPTLGLRLPLFDWGRGRTARGHADLQIAEAAVRARELDVIRDVKAADARVRTARQRVDRYRHELIPAREQVVEQTQRELNYMLVDVFELLAVRQQGFAAYGAYIDALRDYWIARAALARAVGRRLPSTPEAPEALSFDLSRPQLDATPDTQTPAAMQMPAMPGEHLLHHDEVATPHHATPPGARHEH